MSCLFFEPIKGIQELHNVILYVKVSTKYVWYANIYFGYSWQPVICKYAGARNSKTVFITNYLNYSIVVMYHNTTHHDFHLGRFFAVLGPTHYRIMYVRGFQIDDA